MVYRINRDPIIDNNRVLRVDRMRVGGLIGTQAQGSTAGYTSGGFISNGRVIDKFPFSTDANATDVGDTLGSNPAGTYDGYSGGASSSSHGYLAGGYPSSNVLQKFSFSVDGNATDVGDLSFGNYGKSGTMSETHGYMSGGHPSRNTIDKFPFSSDANASDIGDLTVGRYSAAGSMSRTHGYASGGTTATSGLPTYNVIDKFPFASDANATDVGDLLQFLKEAAGASSHSHGYLSGGAEIPSPGSGPPFGDRISVIQKFSFSVDANSTDVGDISSVRSAAAGQSSGSHGYSSGGSNPPSTNVIEKYPFSIDNNATDVGDLTTTRYGVAGQQV